MSACESAVFLMAFELTMGIHGNHSLNIALSPAAP